MPHRQRTAAREGVKLADASRLRMGQPDLAPLVRRALASPPARPLRRAWQWHVPARRARCELRHVGPRSRNGRRRGRARSISAPGDLSRRSDRDRVRGEASRARHAPGALRRVRGGNEHVGTPQELEARRALASLLRLGWGLNNPAFCKTFTCRFIPEATPEHEQWFDELQRVSTSPENAARLMERDDDIDVRPLLSQVKTPTLVIHCDRDRAVPPEKGRLLAAEIPGARYVSLPSANHLMLEEEPAWSLFLASSAGPNKAGNWVTRPHRDDERDLCACAVLRNPRLAVVVRRGPH